MSKPLPFMRFWPSDYLADTGDLTVEQHGAYMLVLMHMWMAGGTLPDDDTKNARRLGVTLKQWQRYKADLAPLLTTYGPDGDRKLTQKRLQMELNVATENSARQAAKAKKAAGERWERERVLKGMQRGMLGASPQAQPRNAIVTNKDITTSLQNPPREEDVSHETQTTEQLSKLECRDSVTRLLNTNRMKRITA